MEQGKNSFRRDLNLEEGVTPTVVWQNYRANLSILTDNVLSKLERYKDLNNKSET